MQKTEDLFENTPISKAILKLALPTVMGQIILVIYNMADTFFIGLTNSNIKITAVTICMPAFMFMSAIANLFGVGGSSVISRALGKMNNPRAKSASAFSFWGCAISAVLYSLFVALFSDSFISFLGGSDPEVKKYATQYLYQTVVLAGFATTMGTLMSHLFRSEGKALHASLGVALGGVLNIALDPLFMFVILEPGNEVLGAALATGISNVIGFVYYLVVLFATRKTTIVSLKLTKDSFSAKIPSCIFSAGIPACIMTLAENISYAVLDNLMSKVSIIAQAGVGVAKKVNMLAHSIVRGITQGALPLLGYSYSSGNRKKTRETVNTTVKYAVFTASICMIINLVFAHQLINIFIQSDNPAMNYGMTFLRILCIGGPFSAWAYTYISFFQAVGHGKQSFILALLRKGILDIPLMFVLMAIIPVYGIVMATPICDIICCITATVLFSMFSKKHLSKNKHRKIFNPETGLYDVIN